MKKVFYFLVALAIAGCIATYISQVWRSTAFLRTHSDEGMVLVGELYNASRWAKPLPLKKIHRYTATLAPNSAVVIESDQELIPGQQHFIRFLKPQELQNLPPSGWRPIPGLIRPRIPDDPTPPQVDKSLTIEHAGEHELDSLAEIVAPLADPNSMHPVMLTEAAPFLIGGANDSVLELIWNNTQTGEWIALIIAVILFKAVVLHALAHPWRTYRPRSEAKDFVHPSLISIDADPIPPPPERIAFKRRVDHVEADCGSTLAATGSTGLKLKLARKQEKDAGNNT